MSQPNKPTCREMRTINGVTYCYFVQAGKMTCLPMGQFLANAGLKVRT